jgi:hypothetical protein
VAPQDSCLTGTCDTTDAAFGGRGPDVLVTIDLRFSADTFFVLAFLSSSLPLQDGTSDGYSERAAIQCAAAKLLEIKTEKLGFPTS